MSKRQLNALIAEHFGAKWIWKWKVMPGESRDVQAVRYLCLCWPSEGYNYDPDSQCQKLMKGKMGEEILATTDEIHKALQTEEYEMIVLDYITFLEYGKKLLTFIGYAR